MRRFGGHSYQVWYNGEIRKVAYQIHNKVLVYVMSKNRLSCEKLQKLYWLNYVETSAYYLENWAASLDWEMRKRSRQTGKLADCAVRRGVKLGEWETTGLARGGGRV